MKKILSVFIAMLLCLSITACSGSSGKADEELVGKYICVSGTMLGITMSGDQMSDFEIELQSKGKATIKVSGESYDVKWHNDDTTLTVNIDGVDAVGELGKDTITFKEFLKEQVGVAMDLIFAKEGTDAANPENYMPEEEKALLGDWTGVSVADVLGDDISSEVEPSALEATFNDDHSATISFMGEELGSSKWTMLSESIIFDDDFDGGVTISGDYKDGKFTLTYNDDSNDAYYVFTMGNGESTPSEDTKDDAETEDSDEDKAVKVPDVPEPQANGDGKTTLENVARLIKYLNQYEDINNMGPTYEEMVAVAGVEGEDLGNKGPNQMTDYGDHVIRWYADADNAYVDFTFRLKEGADAWRARQWVSQNIESADVDNVDVSDLFQ